MKNFSLKWLSILGLIFSSSLSMAQQDHPVGQKYMTLYMGIRQSEILSHLPPGYEFLGDFRNFVDAELDSETKTLHFTPKRPGLATMTLHDRKGQKLFEYRIEVRKSELTRVVREVRSLLHDIEGISIIIANNKVLIDGKVLLPKDFNRIQGVINQYGPEVVASLVEINPIAQKKIAEIIERDINNPDIEVRAVNGKFILKGIANSDGEKKKAVIIAKFYVPPPVINAAENAGVIKKRKEDVVIDLLTVRAPPSSPPPKIIQLVVHYVELSKKYLRSSSFNWAPGLADNTSVSYTKDTSANNDGIVTQISGVISRLLPKLNWAKQHGFARVLKSTSVTTKDGQEGRIQAVEQIPFLIRDPANLGSSTTQQTEVGVTSTITPTIVNPRSDIIQLKMQFEVSSVVGVTASGPQVARNKVNTLVDVRSGQSAAIGGLIGNDSGTEYNPDPQTDALFNLYSAKDFRRNKSQFVVFVTPIIKSSASAGSEKIKRKFRLRE